MAFRRILAALICLVLLVPAALLAVVFLLPGQFGTGFLAELPDKYDLLTASDSGKPRLIVVGGSSVPFGINSSLLAEAFPDYTPVDFGLYAAIGTPVMLELLAPNLRPGDLVIIAPEQNSEALSMAYSADALWQALDGRWDILAKLSPHRFSKMAAAFPTFAGKKLHACFFPAREPEDIYKKSSFNAAGDIASPLRTGNVLPEGWDKTMPVSFQSEELDPEFLQALNAFAATAKTAGASVYYRFPPINRSALTQSEEWADRFYDTLQAQLDFPILGNPRTCILDSGWFYDTNFHLNASGSLVFTAGLIDDLKTLFRDTTPSRIALPPMPAFQIEDAPAGDNRDWEAFTYCSAEGGLLITGLTPAGQALESLIVPTHTQGQPVLGFAENLFPAAPNLRSVTLQGNIRALYDGMFRQCGNLASLHLTQPPTAVAVGSELRGNQDFLIYVPQEYVDDYRRNYSWQSYAAWIFRE